ncbi:Cytochrome P450 monooxygenase patH [Frankliniella fusca]|uniref:Cytochrome P450 monooxygenase patH n=1 Tax=Frankliniella fusca TaxID=407009 RepID=A0AAE1LDX0_9NEOP|nr:Cytochrome P450 monooxygenase patH [Frankliniella fusca]
MGASESEVRGEERGPGRWLAAPTRTLGELQRCERVSLEPEHAVRIIYQPCIFCTCARVFGCPFEFPMSPVNTWQFSTSAARPAALSIQMYTLYTLNKVYMACILQIMYTYHVCIY